MKLDLLIGHLVSFSRLFWQDLLDTFKDLFVTNINDSSVSLPILGVYVTTAFVLLRLGLAVDYISEPKCRIFQSIFSKRVFLTKAFKSDFSILMFNEILLIFVELLISPMDSEHFLKLARPKADQLVHAVFGAHPPGLTFHGPIVAIFYSLSLLLAFDFGYYVAHRLMHGLPFLWAYHEVHHSARVMSVFTLYRFHVADLAMFAVFTGVSTALMSAVIANVFVTPPEVFTIAGFTVFDILLNALSLLFHSNIWWSWGRLEYLLYSPAMHHIHHSQADEDQDKNFALFFSIADRLFGTFKAAPKRPPEGFKTGLRDGAEWDNLSVLAFFYRPVLQSYFALRQFLVSSSKGAPAAALKLNSRELK